MNIERKTRINVKAIERSYHPLYRYVRGEWASSDRCQCVPIKYVFRVMKSFRFHPAIKHHKTTFNKALTTRRFGDVRKVESVRTNQSFYSENLQHDRNEVQTK